MMVSRSSISTRPLVIVITGPTASGKSDLALRLAECQGGEIICADSRTVYRGMDIGTAKPSCDDQARVPHHLIDVADPSEKFTAADFQRLAWRAIDDISARGKIPFVVGGSGLYIDGLILDYQFGSPVDESERQKLNKMSIDELQSMLKKRQIPLPHNHNNHRHLVRALEQNMVNDSRKHKPDDQIIVVSIATERSQLERNITSRADQIFASGIVIEAERLAAQYGWESEAMTGNIYPIIRRVINGELSIDEAKELSIIKDRQLAKKQITWLKRHDYVKWLSLNDAEAYISQRLLPA